MGTLSMASAHSAHANPAGRQRRQAGRAGRAPEVTLLGARDVCMQHLHPCHRRSHDGHVCVAVSPTCVTVATMTCRQPRGDAAGNGTEFEEHSHELRCL